MAQSAIDLCAAPDDFEKSENVVVTSRESDGARRYLKLPFSCQLVSYGNNVVASVSPEFREIAENYINKYPVEHLFETPHLHALNEKLMEKRQKICFMAEYFLPDMGALRALDCPYEMRLLTQSDFADLYLPEWSNALCKGSLRGPWHYPPAIRNGICAPSVRLQTECLSDLPDAVPIATLCGRSALTFSPNIAGRELPRHSPAVLPSRF